ncbi:alpha-L-fucosidase-like [Liolophura sinensis]|uniref:alpha-L-fucosidase-like n=1 Tax=Liolophura sinensis TaxID=3198878 RepID=UPI0031590398
MVKVLFASIPIAIGFLYISGATAVKYESNWASLDSRPLPTWFDEVKFGVFICWGVYSVPSYGSPWFWWYWKGVKSPAYQQFMEKNYPPGFTYADFAPLLKAELFDPDQWADIIEASGAKYVVITAKHHGGFTLWPSENSWNWNSGDTGPHRDLVGDLATAIRRKPGIHYGVYHSMFEWFNPLYLQDKANNFTTNEFVKTKTMPELYDLVNRYKPEVIYSDGDWEAPDTYWNSTGFLAWLYNDSPVKDTVAVNDRWGNGTSCRHGGYYDCMDRYSPGVLQSHKWENAMTIDRKSWGYRREAPLADYLNMDHLTQLMAETVSCGGNLLMNIGPTHDGRIVPIYEERLRDMGAWLKVNGEAIYGTKPWAHQNDSVTPGVWYTSKIDITQTFVYAIFLDWPEKGSLFLQDVSPNSQTRVTLLGYEGEFDWQPGTSGGITVEIPPIPINRMPCKWAWTLKFQNLVL